MSKEKMPNINLQMLNRLDFIGPLKPAAIKSKRFLRTILMMKSLRKYMVIE